MIESIFNKYHLELSSGELSSFEKFLELFEAYNSHTNLSAIRDREGIVEKHFVDSIMLDLFEELHGKVLDIGSGGGFPGIPLKIIHPELDFTLLDSVGKKVKAMNHFIEELGLDNIRAIQARAEEVNKKPEYHELFDFIVSRATAYMPTILQWALPFLKKDGKIILYKMPNKEEQEDGKKALHHLKARTLDVHNYTIADQHRIFIVISKN